MPATVSQSLLSQDCLGKLNQILGLAMHTAEAASAEVTIASSFRPSGKSLGLLPS